MGCRLASWVLRSGVVCALALGVGLGAWAQMPAPPAEDRVNEITLTPSTRPLQTDVDRPVVPFRVWGSLKQVNAGRVSPWSLFPVDTTRWIAGFGAGSLEKDTGVGETLTIAGRTFIRTVDPKKGVKLVEVTKPYLSPFAMAAVQVTNPAQEVFPRPYRLENAETSLLHSVLERLANDAGGPIGVLGWAEMPDVEGIALKRAPIDNVPLTGSEKDRYLETIQQKNANVAFFAVVVPSKLPRPSLNASVISMKSMEYDAAQGQPSAALIHVHAALVDKPAPADYNTAPLILDGLRAVTVKDICHLYGFSTVKRGTFLVYRLDYFGE